MSRESVLLIPWFGVLEHQQALPLNNVTEYD